MGVEQSPGHEGLVAVSTLIRPLAGVVSLVYDEGRVLGEGLAACVAGVRLLAGVRPLVHHQRGLLAERLAAHVADQRLLAAVQAQVVLQRALGRDGLAAELAVVLVLAGVRLHVHHQRVLVGEHLAAELALVLHRLEVRVVDLQVARQGVVVGELLAAGGAHVLLGTVLHVHVAVQLRVREEALVADLAVPRVPLEVASVVGGQLRRLDERAAAHVADEVTLVRVDPPVHRQRVRPLEGLVADVALIRTRVAVRHQVAFEQVLRPEELRAHVAFVERWLPHAVPPWDLGGSCETILLELLLRRRVLRVLGDATVMKRRVRGLVLRTFFLRYTLLATIYVLFLNGNRNQRGIRTFAYRRLICNRPLRWVFISEKKGDDNYTRNSID